jgi:hypothetical protein
MTKLYSLNGARPAPLPARFVDDTGQTRTDLSSYVDEQLEAWGFVPATEPPAVPDHHRLEWKDGAWKVAPPDQSLLLALVRDERDRRLRADFEFNGKMFQRDPVSMSRINGAGTLALAAILNGAQAGDLRWHGGEEDFGWIASDDSVMPMDAQTCIAFGQTAAAVESRLVFAAKALREIPEVPLDFEDDKYWV